MSERPPVPAAPPPPHPDRSPAAPLFCWLVIQLVALSLAVFRVPLSARFPPPGEQFAIHVLLVTQIIASAMLFPFLLRDARTSAIVILTIAPFMQLASMLSEVPTSRAALAAAYVAAWLTTLALWRGILRTRTAEMLGVACAVALTLGAAIVWYVHAESRAPGPIDWSRDGWFGPVLGAIAQVEARSIPLAPWIAPCVLLIVGAVARVIARKREVGRSGNPRDRR
jgi:hypothetical protein